MKDGVADSHLALVGRQHEMAVLWSRFEESTAGRLQVALVASIFSASIQRILTVVSCLLHILQVCLRDFLQEAEIRNHHRGPNAGDVPRHSGKGEPDAEGAAFARRTFSSDATTQLFDQGLCDRKS
jgi:hypothetical protein